MTKTVCIVGAGPSGLVAARTFLHDRRARGRFRVTVVDAQARVGGLWPSSPEDCGGLVHPQMLANQSCHTVQLSGLAWPEDTPEFPRAWQVGAYLQRYHERFLAGRADVCVRLGWRVVRAEPYSGRGGPGDRASDRGWLVWTEQQTPREAGAVADWRSETFDYLVVASGFFGEPQPAPALGIAAAAVPVVHSSRYRDLATLLPVPEAASPGRILVVGGQFSGIEIAGTIANHLAAAENAPDSTLAKGALSIHHLIQRPTWVFPMLTSPNPSSPTPPFLPFDLVSYNLRKRPYPLANTQGHIDVATARRVHGIFQTILGTDQSEYGPALTMRGADVLDAPPYIGVSDTYLEHVREGRIAVRRGRLAAFSEKSATVTTDSGPETLPVAAVVLANGFSPARSLSFLPDEIRDALSFDPDSMRHPVALAFHQCCHPDVPGLAFVGYYRSPYWGVMEMQARLAAALFVADADSDTPAWYPPPLSPDLAAALAADTSIADTLALRTDPRASQFPMGDYVFLMDAFSRALGYPLAPVDDEELDVLTPARYADPDSDTAASLAHTRAVIRAGLDDHRFVARAVFCGLQGAWKLERDLVSALPSHPSGHFVGIAEFRLRNHTDSQDPQAEPDSEYLYVEDGTFTATSGLAFRATRRYVWRYCARTDRLSVWFVRTDDNRRADYLFHELTWSPGPHGWHATAGHLCVDDFYDVAYSFAFSGVRLRSWTLRYAVRGPKKDYTIAGEYSR